MKCRDGNANNVEGKEKQKGKTSLACTSSVGAPHHGTSTTQLTKTIHTQSIHMEKGLGILLASLVQVQD
jgi:hypothetical protein